MANPKLIDELDKFINGSVAKESDYLAKNLRQCLKFHVRSLHPGAGGELRRRLELPEPRCFRGAARLQTSGEHFMYHKRLASGGSLLLSIENLDVRGRRGTRARSCLGDAAHTASLCTL